MKTIASGARPHAEWWRGSAAASSLLVTGTDTGVGKTVVAAALVLALRERGVEAIGFKPAETGVDPGETADSEVLAAAAKTREPLAEPLLRLAEPLAPAVAAERAGVALDSGEVLARIQALRAKGYAVVVEGAGGLLAPLAWGFTALDLAVDTRLPVVLVARAGLGTLNHVLLSLEALERRAVPVRGVVLNGRRDPQDLAEETNPGVLQRLRPDLNLVVVPRWEGVGAHETAQRTAPLLRSLI